jgi:hypothetical protein
MQRTLHKHGDSYTPQLCWGRTLCFAPVVIQTSNPEVHAQKKPVRVPKGRLEREASYRGRTAGPSTSLRSGRDDNFVEAETDATKHLLPLQQNCHPDRSVAKWRDLLSCPSHSQLLPETHLSPCHPDRSEAKWRDLQCALPTHNSYLSHTSPLVIPTEAYPDFLLRGCQRRPRVRLSAERAACTSSAPRLSTGNPGERSGGICSAPRGSLKSFPAGVPEQ